MKRKHSFYYLLDEEAEKAQGYIERVLEHGDLDVLESDIFVDDDERTTYELRFVTSRPLDDFEASLLIQDTSPTTYALNLEVV